MGRQACFGTLGAQGLGATFKGDRRHFLELEDSAAMKVNHLLIETVALATTVAFALALCIATLSAVAVSASQALAHTKTTSQVPLKPGQSTLESFEGIVTCSQCGARHSASIGKNAADCARVCVHGGAKFALVNGEKTYMLEGDLELLKRVAGRRTKISGVVSGNTIRVASASAEG